MTAKRFPGWLRGWRGPPLAFQILGLLIGGLVVAQLVTLFLTMLLPPAPPSQYGLDDIAAVLRGAPANGDGAALQRLEQAGPPDLSGPGWLVSERSRHELAALMGVGAGDVSLAFYTPLPFAGSAMAPPRPPMVDDGPIARADPIGYAPEGGGPARLYLAQVYLAQAMSPPAGISPGAVAAGDRPGGFSPPPRDAFPPGVATGGPRGGVTERPRTTTRPLDGTAREQTGGTGLYRIDPTPLPGNGLFIPGDGGAAVPPLLQAPGGFAGQGASPFSPGSIPGPGGAPGGTIDGAMRMPPLRDPAAFAPLPRGIDRPVAVETRGAPPVRPPSPVDRPAASASVPVPAMSAGAPPARADPPLPAAPVAPSGAAIAVTPPGRSLFGFAPAPFVEGDFVAALRLADGRWAVVQPADQPFPNAWQRRLLLWFAVAFAVVAPLGWLFAPRLVKPLAGFAAAAEQLGRDPAAATVALDGPAEIGRAAHAFNLMQGRLRSFVDDRTAMVGAISHDLRTPLTRLRFRIEDVPDDQREGMLGEVAEMEAMITSVLEFIRGASTPNLRERLDLRALMDDVAEDAVMIGNDVTVERGEPALVEVDVLGMRRVLDNLLENAVKYGGRARVRLRTEPDAAVAEIFDDGPGLPDDELERVFEPFYRSESARSSDLRGSGLGLAVCRSITRAHGGDVRLMRSPEGFVAQVRVPLAFGSERAAA